MHPSPSLFLALALGLASSSSAQLIFDNTLGGPDYFADNGWLVGTNANGSQDLAAPFVAAASGFVASADLALIDFDQNAGITVGIFSDNAGSVGTLLEVALSVSPLPLIGSPLADPFVTASFSGATFLNAGSAYWLGVAATDDTTWAAWVYLTANAGVVGLSNDQDQLGLSDPWANIDFASEPLYRINGTLAVPEPSALGILAIVGVFSLLASRRRR